MGLFRKKEVKEESEELPELPEFPRLPELPEPKIRPYEREIKSLPSFPSSQFGKDLSQEAVKSALAPQEEREALPMIPPKTQLLKERRTLEISEQSLPPEMQGDLQPSILDTRLPPPVSAPQFSKFSKKTEPVYIRIDKFKSAITHFQEIQAKIYEIENLLKKIKEVKQKEDAELRDWEKELETVKARIDAIDKNIFSRLE